MDAADAPHGARGPAPVDDADDGVLTADPGPLSGLLVLDLGQAAVGPVAASYLGMMGATVVKVEPPSGDMVRRGHPTMRGTSCTFVGNNVTKRSVVLDLKTPDGRASLLRLVAKADVLIENFRSAEIMERLGLGYDAVLAPLNPRLVYVQSSAFGPSGPWVGMYSDEWVTECVSGFASASGAAGGPGEITRGAAPLDWNGAMLNTVACLAALALRVRTSRGTRIATSQFGSSLFAALTRLVELDASGAAARPMGSASAWTVPEQAFRTADGWLAVSAPTDRCWTRLCTALGLDALGADPSLAAASDRVAQRGRVVAALTTAFASRSTVDWTERLRANDVPCASVAPPGSLSEGLLAHPQVAANRMLLRIDSAFGPILTQAPHWSFERTPAAIRRPSPRLGEHTDAVLASIDAWRPWPDPTPDEARHEGALTGTRVVVVAGGVPARLAAHVFAQLGASVLRTVDPHGEPMDVAPPLIEGRGALARALDVGVYTLVADLRTDDGRAAAREALAGADLVLTDVRTPALERLGLAHAQVRELAPRAVWLHVDGWGREGPMRDVQATELLVQVSAGLCRFLGRPGDAPVRMGFDVVTVATALSAVQAGIAALLARGADGPGQRVDVSMLGAAIALNQWPIVAESGPDTPIGRPLQGPSWPVDHGFACREGRCLIGFREQPTDRWRRFAIAIGRVDLVDTPAFAHAVATHAALLAPALEPTLRAWSMAALERLVRDTLGGTIVPVLDLPALLVHPQTTGLGVVDRSGPLRVRFPLDADAALLAVNVHA